MLSQDVQAYLAVRRAMGFAMKWSGNLLRSFAAFSDAQGQHHVRSEIAIKWAGSAPSVRTRARRLGLVIRLARYLRAEDQHHEVPPPAFGREERPRRTPYIYSREDVQRLVQAASGVGRYPNPEYRGLTYSTFFGLLACTGMRLSEAINLRLQDITADGLVIRNTKFRKSRLIPLHPTAQAALERYLPKRRAFCSIRRSRVRWLAKAQATSARRVRRVSEKYREDRPSNAIRVFRGRPSMRCATHLQSGPWKPAPMTEIESPDIWSRSQPT